ncbi:xanthine dehydrogenase accessory protein XdhC [Falsirhodobacter sp. 20TX0035]|uniref:xanthine dehydrogenase accessory protein XdhC n=1 Tax=Falsirhodobacter sp. 20TX0035 TaxID=3022019 RepID=UPI00232EDA8F|nr:xanthine dehydrogenase accessory protein XdhC [Falsirhodobacter sp. 20TX0035]MDB6454511.1 xanthine dehydrogenase accessory protein XdhC [Falsirhodobacter sp. 20TX0035]
MAERGFDIEALRRAVACHGRVVRVVVAAHQGSSPREVGAAMLVWDGGTEGTIGGGALEWEAIRLARQVTAPRLERMPLGPKLGQCCGGTVTLLLEPFTEVTLTGPVLARGEGEMPLPVRRILAQARDRGVRPPPQLIGGWMVEPVAEADRPLWIWGAGHVGRALVGVMAPLPGFDVTWIDTDRARFPDVIPDGVAPLWAADPVPFAAHAPVQAEHLILTYSHALDLAICHALLRHGFGWAGLIGSQSKKARFARRLRALGQDPDRIACPIGDPALGKHPQQIAVGVAAQLLGRAAPCQRADRPSRLREGEKGRCR